MFKTLVINATDHETRVALLEDGTIAEIFIRRKDDADIAGNIYKGRVQRVLPGMQAAFVDIGLNQAAFIYVDDVLPDTDGFADFFPDEDEDKSLDAEPDEDSNAAPNTEDEDAGGDKIARISIEDLLTEGQEMLIQVAKAPIGTKGSRVTSHISLPGRFLVMMPASNHVGVSRRIEDEEERTRLKEMLLSIREDHTGFIIRTAAEGVEKEKLIFEMDFLKTLWKKIQERNRRAPSPSLVHQELPVSLRAARDLLLHDADRLVVDSRAGYDAILSFLDTIMPSLKDSVEFYEGSEPVFDAFNLEGDISRALKRKVWLKSGGYIVIEMTEALTAIDVNTGRYVGKHNLEETILKTNLEAVKEIAYQIRLRDIGGIIIIDFIDMEKKSNNEKVYLAVKEALKKDRSKTHVLPMSDLGLIQMTRKRTKKALSRMLCEPCFYCDGEGFLMSGRSICYNIYKEVMRESGDMTGSRIALLVNPKIADLLHREENNLITSLESATGRRIVIYPNSRLHIEAFDIVEKSD